MGERAAELRDAVIEASLDEGLRRRHGQHFTKNDPADLLIALCVRHAGASVLDPACGTGNLLERAAARRRFLGGEPGSEGLLLGVEMDARLAHAARAQVPAASIINGDFLDAVPSVVSGTAPVLPRDFDAIVGNPPYVRQELIDPRLKAKAPRGGLALSGRSDLHARFWPAALALLRPGGRLGFIASGAWLDAGYGAALRDWLAAQHRIVAIIESQAESWFDRARVRTVIAIVQREPPDASRPTRFVSLRAPLAALVPAGLPEPERLARFDRLARAIEGGEAADHRIVVRSVPAAALGGRTWGALLRLPDLCFEILERGAARMVPLSEVATVRWGIKTGDDTTFCPPRDGQAPVEEEFLSPIVFTLAELDRLVVTREPLRRWVVLVDRRRSDPGGRGAARLRAWLARAERERASHLRPTCAARAGADRAWYELRPSRPGAILWSIMHQYRHLAPLNPEGLPVNDNLLQIDPKEGVSPRLLAAILNSHVTALVKHAHGRQRNEGMLKTQAADLKAMPILDPRMVSAKAVAALIGAFDAIAARQVGTVAVECAQDDRRALDRLVLEALGWTRREVETAVDRLYRCLKTLHDDERRWEIDALRRRRR